MENCSFVIHPIDPRRDVQREYRLDQVQEIEALGERHGFKLAGFRSFERAVTDTEIERVRQAARRRLSN